MLIIVAYADRLRLFVIKMPLKFLNFVRKPPQRFFDIHPHVTILRQHALLLTFAVHEKQSLFKICTNICMTLSENA